MKLEFTMPEALTKWKFLGFAHDAELRGGLLTDEAVTAKDLMVQPNPPRFLREGDELEFTVKVTNQSATRQSGTVRLSFGNARTAKSIDAYLGNTTTDQSFDLAAKESQSFSWRLTVPDIVRRGDQLQGRRLDRPDLRRRGGPAAGARPPHAGHRIAAAADPRPADQGIQVRAAAEIGRVEDLAEPEPDGADGLATRRGTRSWPCPTSWNIPTSATSRPSIGCMPTPWPGTSPTAIPKIHRVFEQWRGTPALDSPLEKNQDLKSVMLEETPWVRQAQSESQARRNVGILFEDNRLNDETARALKKLAEGQYQNGAWPWFPGGPPSDYITLYITTGFGRLRHLGVKIDMQPAFKSLARLDGWIDEIYREILRNGHKDENHLSPTIALYLYGRSFFLEDRPIAPQAKEAVDYFLGQARKHWLSLADRQSQAHLAVALKRFADKPAARHHAFDQGAERERRRAGHVLPRHLIVVLVVSCPDRDPGYMIEAFDEVMDDQQSSTACWSSMTSSKASIIMAWVSIGARYHQNDNSVSRRTCPALHRSRSAP